MNEKKVLFIDNFDSFVFNLVEEFEKRECKVKIVRANISEKDFQKIVNEFQPNLIVVSPGPSSPKEAGISNYAIKEFTGKIPVLGICLGHQCGVEVFGGKVEPSGLPVHGKKSKIIHNGKTIFKGIEKELQVGRYHSLIASKVPECLEVSAKTREGIVMAVRHKEKFFEGVQFHPESIMTTQGGKIIENVLEMISTK